MPPIPVASAVKDFHRPRVILYQQTHHDASRPVSLLPLVTAHPSGSASLTHLILAAIHLNDPGFSSAACPKLSLNDHDPTDGRFAQLWDEVLVLQSSGIKVLCMLGGAARGSFARLDYAPSELSQLPKLSSPSADGGQRVLPKPTRFDQCYIPLRDFIRARNLDGIDLDVEEEMSLHGIVHLIDRLRADFGPSSGSPFRANPDQNRNGQGFIVTLAPVATALLSGYRHLSGFNYLELERLRGSDVDWYNVQFYNGWGTLEDDFPVAATMADRNITRPSLLPGSPSNWKRDRWSLYDVMIRLYGWKAEKVVVGLLTNPRHGGSGYTGWNIAARVLGELVDRYEDFGGVMGWEYWRALPELENDARAGQNQKKSSIKAVMEGQSQEAAVPIDRNMNESGDEEEKGDHYWRWAWRMGWIFTMREIRDRAVVVASGRSLAGLSSPMA